jgi:hypothetical protein
MIDLKITIDHTDYSFLAGNARLVGTFDKQRVSLSACPLHAVAGNQQHPSDCGGDSSGDERDIDLPLKPACVDSCSIDVGGGAGASAGSGANVRSPARQKGCDGVVGGGGCLRGSSSRRDDQQLSALPGIHIPCLIAILT